MMWYCYYQCLLCQGNITPVTRGEVTVSCVGGVVVGLVVVVDINIFTTPLYTLHYYSFAVVLSLAQELISFSISNLKIVIALQINRSTLYKYCCYQQCKARQTLTLVLRTEPKSALFNVFLVSSSHCMRLSVWRDGGLGEPDPSYSHCQHCIYDFNTSCVERCWSHKVMCWYLFPVCNILRKCWMLGRGCREGQSEARSGERRNHLYWSPYKDIRLQALTV